MTGRLVSCCAALLVVAGCRHRVDRANEAEDLAVGVAPLVLVDDALVTTPCPPATTVVITRDAIHLTTGPRLVAPERFRDPPPDEPIFVEGPHVLARKIVRLEAGALREIDAPPSTRDISALTSVLGVTARREGSDRSAVFLVDAATPAATVGRAATSAVDAGYRVLFAVGPRGARSCTPFPIRGARRVSMPSMPAASLPRLHVSADGATACEVDREQGCGPTAEVLARFRDHPTRCGEPADGVLLLAHPRTPIGAVFAHVPRRFDAELATHFWVVEAMPKGRCSQ